MKKLLPGVGNEMRWAGLTHGANKVCMSCGEMTAHSHYGWAVDEVWATYGQLMSGGSKMLSNER